MANRDSQKRTSGMNFEQRKRRRNQIVFAVLSIVLILSWVASLLIQLK